VEIGITVVARARLSTFGGQPLSDLQVFWRMGDKWLTNQSWA
jgi:hypothetical protein